MSHPLLDDPDTLWQAYHQIGMSQNQLADFCGCVQATVWKRLKDYGIETRSQGSEKQYSDQELLDWIHAYAEEFETVPSVKDVHHWPGPCPRTYRNRYGKVTNAIREAGYEPRGDRS